MESFAQEQSLDAFDGASGSQWENGVALVRALDHWCRRAGAGGAAVLRRCSDSARVIRVSTGTATDGWLDDADTSATRLSEELELRYRGGSSPPPEEAAESSMLVAAAARLLLLHEELKEQRFQENYKVVTLEALHDVGLAVTSTLDLDRLCDEILLRAVSLLDARKGALYLIEEGAYRLQGTIGGDALPSVSTAPELLAKLLEDGRAGDSELLPGARHVLVVPIEVEGSRKGLLGVADKESRTGVGPFVTGDRRALSLFASQAAIALENARLHRAALEKERLEREMDLAAEIQRAILPSAMPEGPGLEILGWNRPARHVGGDYYGSIEFRDGRLGLVVADVTGKGMPAALLVSTLHSALHLLLDGPDSGAGIIAKLNQHVADSSQSNKFITMILIELSPDGDQLRYVNAGHNPGLLIRDDGSSEQLRASGLPLGLMPGSTYDYTELDWGPGDLICLYSDGITECERSDEVEYGEERLTDFLAEHRTLPLPEILERLDHEVTTFGAGLPQGDDQTVVLLRRRRADA